MNPVTPEETARVVREFLDRIDAHDFSVIDEMLGDEPIEVDDPAPGQTDVKAMAHRFYETITAGFPDYRQEIVDVVIEGDKAAVILRMQGTHTGEFFGKAPTGKRMDVKGVDIYRVRDGKLHVHWGVTDIAAWQQQIGLQVPGPEPPDESQHRPEGIP